MVFLVKTLLIRQNVPKNAYFLPKNRQRFSGHVTSKIFIYHFCKISKILMESSASYDFDAYDHFDQLCYLEKENQICRPSKMVKGWSRMVKKRKPNLKAVSSLTISIKLRRRKYCNPNLPKDSEYVKSLDHGKGNIGKTFH